MSEALYILVKQENPPGEKEPGKWTRADVMLNGEVCASGFAPNYGVYQGEGVAAKSAVALAKIHFSQEVLSVDIRYNKEVNDSSDTPYNE